MLMGSFVGRLEELLQTLSVELRNFKEFANWMHVSECLLIPCSCLLNTNCWLFTETSLLRAVVESVQPVEQIPPDRSYVPIDTIRVAEFLQTSFISDRLAPFFVRHPDESLEPFLPPCEFPFRPGDRPSSSPAHVPDPTTPSPRNTRGASRQPSTPTRSLPLRPAYPFIFVFPSELPPDVPRPTLRGFTKRIEVMCEQVFNRSADVIGQSLRVAGSVEITSTKKEEARNGGEREGKDERKSITQMRVVEKVGIFRHH